MSKGKENFAPRDIPSGIKREVRQICGFGCVICRCPIYEYEHIEEYSVVGEHTVENLALLCPTCHAKKGKKHITKEFIRSSRDLAKNKPLRSDQIQKTPYTIDLGSNLIQSFDGGVIFDILGFGYLTMGFTDSLCFSGKFLDCNGEVAFEISDNEILLNHQVWDIEYAGGKIILRYDLRKIFLSIDINSEKKIITIRGKYFIDKIPISINDEGICIGKKIIAKNNHVINAAWGLFISDHYATYESGQKVGGALSGTIQRCTLSGHVPIHILNPVFAGSNFIHSCNVAIYITHDFLLWLYEQKKLFEK